MIGFQESFIFVQKCEYLLVVKIPENFAAVKFTVAVSDHFHSLISCTNEVHFI